MTTLQTLSTRNQDSASPAVERAQSGGNRADDAPGFSGVFDEVLNEFPDSEPDDTEQTTDSESAESQPGIDNGQAGEGELAPQIQSVGDLSGLLTNAAAIDIASLATQELEGDQQNSAKAEANQIRQDGARSDSAQSKTDLLAQLAGSNRKASIQERPGLQNQQTPTQSSTQGTEVAANPSDIKPESTKPSAVDQANQKQAAVQQPVESQQPVQSSKIQVAQVAQAMTADVSRNARSLDGVRSINEIAGFAAKSRVISGSESSSGAGSDQGGLDLGNRSKNTSRILQTKQPEDGGAIQRQQVIAQVQRGLASIMNTKGGSMKLRLSPEHLGEVNIQLMTKDGHVSVKIDAKNNETREMLKDGLEGLRNAMESRGVRVDDLSIEGRQSSSFQRMFSEGGADGAQDQAGQRQNQSDSRSSHEHADNGGGGQESNEIGGIEDGHVDSEPRGIWTDLGLDAIA